MDCNAAREQLHDYVSGELPAPETSQVDGHLSGCPDCARAFGLWGQFRRSVHRAGTGQTAPAALKARVIEQLSPLPRRATPVPWLLAAAAVIAVAFTLNLLFVKPTGPDMTLPSPPTTLLAGLAADHERHALTMEPFQVTPPAEQQRLITTFEKRLGAKLDVPEKLPDGFDREQCHLCPVASEKIAHVQYASSGRTVSLFMVPADDVPVDGRILQDGQQHEARVGAESLLAWRRGQVVYVLVSREQPATLAQLATAFNPRSSQ